MDKDRVVELLTELGHEACIEDGSTVMIMVGHIPNKKEFKKLEKDIKSTGYDASWGWRVKGR